MKHKVSELEGTRLDAAVAKALGWVADVASGRKPHFPIWTCHAGWIAQADFTPSTDWMHGGPIVQSEAISIVCAQNLVNRPWWHATAAEWHGGALISPMSATTPLIAAMRAFVASKLGEEVDLPG